MTEPTPFEEFIGFMRDMANPSSDAATAHERSMAAHPASGPSSDLAPVIDFHQRYVARHALRGRFGAGDR